MNTPSCSAVAACAGAWRGSNRLHDPHTNAPDDSPSVLTVTPVVGGRFVRIDYTWSYQDNPQEGSLLLGGDPEQREVTAHWTDTWHYDRKVMACQGSTEADGRIVVQGAYPCPPGPDWGWRIEIKPDPGRALEVRMFNLTPDGQSAPAVEAIYAPAAASSSTPRTLGTEQGLADLGQIAITVQDVGAALTFYRDVLGLQFLFSPGPNLAFLAAGAVRLMLTRREGAGAVGGNSSLYFIVSNVGAVFEAVVQRGATSERPPQLTARMPDHELWMAFVRDPEGNLIGLMEEKRP